MNRDITARETALQTHAGSAEHHYTIWIRFVCPNDPRHYIGRLETGSGSGWSLTGLQASDVQRFLAPLPKRPGTGTENSIFDFMDDAEPDSPPVEPEPDRLERRTVGRSVLRWDFPPAGTGEPRIRWTCCHCDQDWQRVAKQDNVLKGSRLANLVRLMRDHGPSRLRVELSPRGLQDAADAVLQHAEQHDRPEVSRTTR